MPKLIINRTSEWNNKMRDVEIYLDGSKIGIIEAEQVKEFDIEAGQHILHTKMGWSGSNKLDLKITEKEIKNIALSGSKSWKWLSILVILSSPIYIILPSLTNIPMLYFMILITALVIYFATFRRKNFLILN
jgi:hypothetical protein